MEEFASVISKRAYELFEGRGRESCHEMDDWLKAESELLQKPDIEVTESGKNVVITAKVKDFSKKDLKVSLEPNRVAICGEKSHRSSKKRGGVTSRESYSELFSQVIDLPVEVNTEKAKARLTDSILHIEAPKA
jgi:HSP20 family protein